jgi:hypothetical protein
MPCPGYEIFFSQEFGQENQQLNEPGFLFSNCCKKKKKNETIVHLGLMHAVFQNRSNIIAYTSNA